jgi:16S rRNA G1207 methylase RsmC
MFTTLLASLNAFVLWFVQAIPVDRLNGDNTGRKWFTSTIGYTKDLQQSNLQSVTDRSSINSQIAQRIVVQDVNQKQGIASLKTELAQLYSFQKCFVARHRTRLQYYRDDLSQKGQRNMYAVQLSYDNFAFLQTQQNGQQQ